MRRDSLHRRDERAMHGIAAVLVAFMLAVLPGSNAMAAEGAGKAPVPGDSKAAPATIPSADAIYYSEPDAAAVPSMVVTRPPLQALITIERNLDPFQLDAQSAREVSLADVVNTALRNNLAINSAALDVQSNRWNLIAAYSRFLPDARLGYTYNRLKGHVRLPINLGGSAAAATGPLRINSPFIIAQAGLHYNAFQGGKILFGALQSKNNLRASRFQYHATTNDVLLEATRRYYDLLLNEALLQIRIRAVQTSQEQLRINEDLERDGMATRLDVLQARSQLADDRQNLIEQQITRRNSAIQLAEYLNLDQSVDLQPPATEVQLIRLISEDVTPGRLLAIAAQHRPELKQYREQWLAAKKGIMIAAAPLYPTVQLNATEYGVGETLSNAKRTVVIPPIAPGQAPTVAHVSRQITGLGLIGLSANWNLGAFGLTDTANIQAARAQARKALVQTNEEANTVVSQVRQSYLNQLAALRKSEQNLARVQSSAEELRLAQLRLKSGLGRNIDVLRAQQDLTSALVQHAQSTIDFDIAQAQLLHDLGVISRASLLSATPQTFQ